MNVRKKSNRATEIPNLDLLPDNALLKQTQFMLLLPVGRTKWYALRRSGKIPGPDGYLGPRMPVWTVRTARQVMKSIIQEGGES